MKGRLNLFQAAMLRWRDLDPYNAVHVARIAAPFDRERLRGVISAQLETDGLTGLVLDRQRRRYEYRGGPAAMPGTGAVQQLWDGHELERLAGDAGDIRQRALRPQVGITAALQEI